jgi:ABC-type Na+ efflux pump permease subunit
LNLRQLFVVYRKELTDHRRDRRAIFSAAFGVVLGPVVIGLMLTQIAKDRNAAEDISIPIAGAAYGPALVDWLKQQPGVTDEEAPAAAETAVRDGSLAVAVVISKDFEEDFSQAKPAEVRFVYDSSQNKLRPKIDRVRRLLQGYSGTMGALRGRYQGLCGR